MKDLSTDYGLWYGIRYVLRKTFYYLTSPASYCYHLLFNLPKEFTFQGKTHEYFFHRYNMTWRNERAIEIPIVWELVKASQAKRILELGNVLSHYFPVSHHVVDKYERAKGVAGQDVVDYRSSESYDLIISISTLEHVGWDEMPRDSTKVLRAVENMRNCLAPAGKIVVTVPLGYNRELDRLLRDGNIRFTKQYCMKRISRNNEWTEADWADVRHARFDDPYHSANVVLIGIIEKE